MRAVLLGTVPNVPQPRVRAPRRIDHPDFSVHEPLSLDQDLDLWRVDLEATAEAESRWQALLSEDEKARAQRFHFDRDRRHFSAARGLLRIVLAGYLGAQPQALRFRYLEKGKPELAEPSGASALTFNVSHSGGVALFGVTQGRPVGVDVEKIREDFDTEAIARRFFSAREQEQLAALPQDQRHRAFFRCWTLKESFIKALGEGLSHPLHQFDVTLDSQSPISLTTRPDESEAQNWHLQLVDVGLDHAAAFSLGR